MKKTEYMVLCIQYLCMSTVFTVIAVTIHLPSHNQSVIYAKQNPGHSEAILPINELCSPQTVVYSSNSLALRSRPDHQICS